MQPKLRRISEETWLLLKRRRVSVADSASDGRHTPAVDAGFFGSAAYFTRLSAKLVSMEAMHSSRVSFSFRKRS